MLDLTSMYVWSHICTENSVRKHRKNQIVVVNANAF